MYMFDTIAILPGDASSYLNPQWGWQRYTHEGEDCNLLVVGHGGAFVRG